MRMCPWDGCGQPSRAQSFGDAHCNTHRSYIRRKATNRNICEIQGCESTIYAREWCPMHYQRWKKHGNPAISLVPARGTGRYVSDGGYVFVHVPESGMSNTGGYVLEHRLVMSGIIGRDLTSGENVHHMNGVRDDNRPENLELWNTSQPAGQRIEDKVAWAKEILALYDPDSLK